MKKLSALFVISLFALGAVADTAIPSGKAVYDITLNFTDYPELHEYGDWPVEFELNLGQPFVGERVDVKTNIVDDVTNILLTVRAVWDIKTMIDYSKTDSYTGGQSKIYTRAWGYTNVESTSADGGVWTSKNDKFDFTDTTTIEGFMSKVNSYFTDTTAHRTMTKPGTRAETGTPVLLNSLSIKLVRNLDSTACVAGTPIVCKLRIRFNRSISAAGYESITSFQVCNKASAGTVFDFSVAYPTVSADGKEIFGLVSADVGSIIAIINSDAYKETSYKGQTTININGAKVAVGSLTWLARTESTAVVDLSESIKKSIVYRTHAQNACRVVGFDLDPKTAGGGLFMMRW